MEIGARAIQPVQPVIEAPRIAEVAPADETRAQADTGSERQPGDRPPEPGRPATLSDVVQRNLTIDPATRTIVYQALNARGEVVLQTPDQAIMRLRAYAREMQRTDDVPEAGDRVERIA